MTVSGDLSTIDLPDLFQSIETHKRSGVLALTGEAGRSAICFREGRIAMLAAPGRLRLADMLLCAGLVTPRKLEAALRKHRGTRKGPVEVLVAMGAVSLQRVREAAEHFLADAVADMVAAASGEFRFTEGETSEEGFDPDEAALGLAVAVGPLLLEAMRRVDHWVMIRKLIPTDSAHFLTRDTAALPEDLEDPDLARDILAALDGTRSVREVADLFPGLRFHVYKQLADFVRDRLVRAAEADDLVAIARQAGQKDAARARTIVARGLEAEPHHAGLLVAEAELAEATGDPEAAAGAHKMLAHLLLEAGKTEEACARLESAKALTPRDPAIWERTLTLALQQGRRQEAVREGLRLVELYRAPGLHAKAKEVLERLVKVDPDSVELRIELARTLVDAGEAPEAVRALTRAGKDLVSRGNYVAARMLYAEVLAIAPGNREAGLSIEMIDKETFARRRERKRRILRCLTSAVAAALCATVIFMEASARVDYVEAGTRVARDTLIEQRRYGEAAEIFRAVSRRHPWTATALFDVRRRLADLEQQARAAPPR